MLCLILSNHTVIIHTRYQDISLILDVLWLALESSTSLFLWRGSSATICHRRCWGSTLLQSLPILNGPCAIKHGDPRVMFPNRILSRPGALACFIRQRCQSVRERDALKVWRQLYMTRVFGENSHRWIFPLPIVVEGRARASTCAGFTLVRRHAPCNGPDVSPWRTQHALDQILGPARMEDIKDTVHVKWTPPTSKPPRPPSSLSISQSNQPDCFYGSILIDGYACGLVETHPDRQFP